MKKLLIAIVLLALIVGIGSVAVQNDESTADATEVSGTITSIDANQISFDGPYVITILTAEGPRDIHVPSMGFPLCAAKNSIESVSNLSVGQIVEANGALTAEGVIVPCESAGHYLRVAN